MWAEEFSVQKWSLQLVTVTHEFPRSSRPPGIEIARIGEAELKEHAEGTSRIGGSDETSIANGEAPAAVVASLSGLDTIKDGETTVSSKGPVGPPRDFARSIDSASSMPSPRTGGIRNHENALASPESQFAEASPSTPVWFEKKPLESWSFPAVFFHSSSFGSSKELRYGLC
uniref:Uncharacterized protein n=1 Tax=Ascaris lumbricoides TaxID=6252 RepID=A0A0M3ISE6_ASCLU